MEQIEKTSYYGSIELASGGLEGVQQITSPTGQQGIFIPFNINPCLYVSTKKDGTLSVKMDLTVGKSPLEGYDLYIKSNVGKGNMQRFGLTPEAAQNMNRFIGNLQAGGTSRKGRAGGYQQQGAPQQGYAPQPYPQQAYPQQSQGGYQQRQAPPQQPVTMQRPAPQAPAPQQMTRQYQPQMAPPPVSGDMPDFSGAGW